MSQFKEMYVCKCPCSIPRLLLYFHLAVWAHVRGHNPRALAHPHTLNYARRIFTVEPITSSIDSCWGAVLCCSCWYFNYRGNLSKSPRLLASTLTRHLSRNQYCSSQPGCSRSPPPPPHDTRAEQAETAPGGSRPTLSDSERVKSSAWGNSGRRPTGRMLLNGNFMHKTAGQVVFSQEIAA